MTIDPPSLVEHLMTRVDGTAGSPDPLARLDAAIAVSAESAAAGDQLLDHFVALARQAGHSWTEVGSRLGVSKQAARQRFVERASPLVLPGAATAAPRLQACLDSAAAQARADGATEIGTHHLLAGLLADGVAAAILDGLGVSLGSVREAAHRLFGPGGAAREETPPMSEEATCAVDVAARHAVDADPSSASPLMRTEHLLFALVLDPGGRGRRVLGELGVDIAAVKRELDRYVNCPPRRRGSRWKRATTAAAACSFCGRSEQVAGRLVAGPGVHICPACVALSADALRQEDTT